MKLSEYQKNATRTCPSLGDIRLDLSHMCLGMISELSELIEAINKNDFVNITEEYADIMWYVSNYCTIRNITLTDVNYNVTIKNDYTYYICELSDLVKKNVAYGKEISIEKEKELVLQIIEGIKDSFYNDMEYAQKEGISISFEQALQNNIDKLKARYPDKFTQEKAINRDLEVERAILERTN